MILTQRRLTFDLYHKVVFGKHSIWRTMEYEILKEIELIGRTLDVGGGEGANYRDLLQVKGELISVNIDPKVRPDHVCDIEEGLPFSDDYFDNIISLNTLEHIANDEDVLEEMARVLAPNGNLYIFVPFLYRVHASPSDFHRHTAYWWEAILLKNGFEKDKIYIDPIGCGQLGAAISVSEFFSLPRKFLGGFIRKLRKFMVLTYVFVGHSCRWPGMERLPASRSFEGDFALGYFIRAKKSHVNTHQDSTLKSKISRRKA